MHLLDALNNSLPEVFRAIDLMGVLLNGILGGKVARERNFDAVGFCILAIMTALAGGMIRDLLLTTRTGAPVAITDPYYLGFAIVGALIAMAFRMDSRAWSVLLVIADGMVLGCWSATGAIKTLDAGFAIMPAILMGIMTAIGGGMVRDISAGLVPRVFGGNNLYATPRSRARWSPSSSGTWASRSWAWARPSSWASCSQEWRTGAAGSSPRPASGPSLSHIRS